MKGLYLRGNTYWLRYADASGRIVFESAKTSNKRDAERLLIKRRAEVMQGAKFGNNATLQEAVNEYLENAKLKPKSFKNKLYFCNHLLQILPPTMRLNKLSVRDFTKLQSVLLERGLKRYTVNVLTTYFKSIVKTAIENDMCNPKVSEVLDKVKKLPGAITQRTEYLTLPEIEEVSQHLSGESKVKFIVFVNTGLRLMELHSLKWTDIKHGFIFIDESKSGKPRQIPINDTVKQALNSLVRPLNDNSKVFKQGEHIFRRDFKEAIRKANINKPITAHNLRHTFASHSVMNGVDLATLQQLLGHSNISMVMRYAHLSSEHTKKAVDKIGNILKKAVSL